MNAFPRADWVGLREYPLDSSALRAGSRALCAFSGGMNAFPRLQRGLRTQVKRNKGYRTDLWILKCYIQRPFVL